jgi:PQQ-dependent catabolism-associated CXXCW motif protein
MNSRTTSRVLLMRAASVVTLLGLLSTASAAQDSFGGKRTTTPPADPSRGGTVAAPERTPPRNAPSAPADKNSMLEREDFGVAPTRTLHNGPMHGPTPSSIPGGQVITTAGVMDLQRRQIPHVLIDVLGGPNMLPNAMPGAWMSEPGSFSDQVQMRATAMLMDATQGKKDTPLVFYCLSPHCWMSYNAALRAINAGFTNVLWYRGGVEAWSRSAQQQ